MTELLDTNTLIKRLRYQGRQYAAGQASRGGNSGPHMLEQAADQLEIALAEGDALRAKLDELEKQEHAAFVNEQGFIVERDDMQISSGEKLYLAAGARPVEPVQKLRPDFIAGYDAGMADAKRIQAAQPAPGAGDQVQMILKHRLMRKVEGDWLAASEFMTGEPDPSWLAKTEDSHEEWRIEQVRRVSGEQIQAGLTRAFASWKKPAPAAVVGPSDLQLLKFYSVTTDAELIAAQAAHIEKLQAKLQQPPSFAPQRVREG